MVRPLSNGLRERVVALVLAGESCRAVAPRFGVAVSSVVKWSQRHRETGSVGPAKMGGSRKRVLEPHRAFIAERLAQTPHLTLHGLRDELRAGGVKVSHNTVWMFLRREGLRFKKMPFALEQGRADIARRPMRWRSLQARRDPKRPVFIDETWIKTNMAPLRGWGPSGRRLRDFAPYGHWRALSFLGALRCDRLDAPCVFDGPINGECFRAYVEQQPVPVLKLGDIVIMDGPGSHKGAAVRRAIRAGGARLWFLPPCSPDLNPIEQTSSMLQHRMRQARQRTVDEIWRRIGRLAKDIQSSECANSFTNAGYASTRISNALTNFGPDRAATGAFCRSFLGRRVTISGLANLSEAGALGPRGPA